MAQCLAHGEHPGGSCCHHQPPPHQPHHHQSPSTITLNHHHHIITVHITHHHPPHHPPSSSSFHVLSRKPQVREAHFSLKEHRAGRLSRPRCVAQPCYSLAVLHWAGHGVMPRNQNYVYEGSINIRACSAAAHVSIPHFLFHK